jgi:deaminated glutathione amidase
MSKIAAIQMCSSSDLNENLKTAERLLVEAKNKGAQMVLLPEMFSLIDADKAKISIKEPLGSGKIQDFLAYQANRQKLWIVGGTIPIAAKSESKIQAACLVYDDNGNIVVCYNKIHLFDVSISAHEIYRESDLVEAGNQAIVFDSPFGRIGLAVCYDIRFPELFRHLFQQGAEIFMVPAAFTMKTGQAHWELLARARAVENFCYFVGACQGGTHSTGRKTFGHSMIIDPWGDIQAKLADGVGVITADIDLAYLKNIRKDIPVHKHLNAKF